MPYILDITGDDIAELNDSDLRTLIGMLCEADYRGAGLPTTGITWGGHQDARDGGLDVVVRSADSPPKTSFIPKKITGFQVKKPNMPKSEILKEMRPKGELREEIRTLIQENGAYLIVSSKGSTSETALGDRINAMKEAVKNEEDYQNLSLDFLDRGRIATWVRSHPTLIIWARNKVGRPIIGWHPYENWSNSPGGIDEEYLTDESLRLIDGTKTSERESSINEGIAKLRSMISIPRISIRLTGLSGVGKTRLVQALFDSRIGEGQPNPYQVIYTDTAFGPIPSPINLANQLIVEGCRAIIIIDNCPQDLHRQLTHLCKKPISMVSLLTIEYDIRDHIPEETSVFRLDPASETLIERLIQTHYPYLSQVDAQTIATFSGGNARIAIALANTIEQGDTLSGFQDQELFERLFWQHANHRDSLLASGEVCSLVYSFEGTDTNSELSELRLLATLGNKTCRGIFRDVAELQRRGLIQSRGVWRAVLPQAIANRLAKRALSSIPKDVLLHAFLNNSDRLLKSFSRRLSYLHDCDIAVEIVDDWLGEDGWIGKSICELDKLQISVLNHIAPVSPSKTLDAIEKAVDSDEGNKFTSRDNKYFSEFVNLLRKIAYDQDLFGRCAEVLIRFSLSEKEGEKDNSSRDILRSLFYIHLSGTHAPIEARAKTINELVISEDDNKQSLGLYLLAASLEAWHFFAPYDFSFGARSRDYGYYPTKREDISNWFSTFITICTTLAISEKPIAKKIRKLLAQKLRGLWTKGKMYEVLEKAAFQIHQQFAWNDGWIEVRGIIKYDSKNFDEEIKGRIVRLESLLKPVNLLERARTYSLLTHHGVIELDTIDGETNISDSIKNVEDKTREIGFMVAKDAKVLGTILPDLVSTQNSRLRNFGRGIYDGAKNKEEMLKNILEELKNTPRENRQIILLVGFLESCAESDPTSYNSILDSMISNEVVGEWFPILQMTSILDQKGIQRLHKALELDLAKANAYYNLAFGRSHESLSDDELAKILEKILLKDDGIYPAIEILSMRFHDMKKDPSEYSETLRGVAIFILTKSLSSGSITRRRDSDYDLADIARVCFDGIHGMDAATQICHQLANAFFENRIYPWDYSNLLNALAKSQPIVFLDEFLGSQHIDNYSLRRIFFDEFEHINNPLNCIADETILNWSEQDPTTRYPLIISSITTFEKSSKSDNLEWKPIVIEIIKRAPDLNIILENLGESIKPISWSGSRTDILQKRSVLYTSLYNHENIEISSWAESEYTKLVLAIKMEREREETYYRYDDERFE